MEAKTNLIEPLIASAEQYSRTSFELWKLKTLDKTADITSTLISRLLLAMTVSVFVLTLNIALALWLGDLLGKSYFGFLIVAFVYGITGIVLFCMHRSIKARINNSIITQMFN